MQKTKLCFLTVAAIVATCLCSSVFATSMKDEVPIPIQYDPSNPPGNDGHPRSSLVSIRVYYDTDLSCVCAYLSNAGTTVAVELTNLTTNETENYIIPGSGLSELPISGNSGYWTITFTLPDRSVYGGYFML